MTALLAALTADATLHLGAALLVAGAIIGGALLVGAPVPAPAGTPTVNPAPAPAAPEPTPPATEPVEGLALADRHPALPDDGEPVIGDALARCIEQMASAIAAARADLDPDVVTRLRDQAYRDLFESLTHAETTRALVAALHEEAEERALVLVNQFRSLPTYREGSR